MEQEHDGFSGCASSNIALLMESARDVIDDIRGISHAVEAKLRESASLDELLPLLMEKRDRVGVLRDLSREITISLGAAETGVANVPLPESQRQQFMDLVSELQALITEESGLENLVCERGLRISHGRK
jgi:hypothetical protein